jgi:autotransporter translocation and assembly factor TamB
VLPEVDRIIGNINLQAKFGGSVKHPKLIDGNVQIKDGRLFITKIENPIKDISLDANINNHKIYISKFEGYSPLIVPEANIFKKFLNSIFSPVKPLVGKGLEDGKIEAEGIVDFYHLNRPKLELNFSLNDAYFNYFLENTKVVINSANLKVAGRDTISVEGDVILKQGEVELDFVESEKNLLLSKSVRQTPPYLQYLLNVDVTDNFFIRSNLPFNTFDIELNGEVQIIREPKSETEFNGALSIISGKYFIQVEEFNIENGVINFVNPKEYPEVNLTARRQKNNYLFDLTVNGPLNNPEKTMRTRNLETNQEYYDLKDQMSLLLFGVDFRQISGLSDSAFVATGGGVLTQTLLNQFEREARQFTGLDRIRFGTQETYDYFTNWPFSNDEQASTLALGKYFTPNLYFEYQTKLSNTNISGLASIPTPSLSWESGNLIYIKYRLTRNWALSSYYQKTLEGNDKVRFDVNWQLSF